ncbi:MAG: hypothetical protein NT013_15800 [Planctomycetia bacterium]|nr:hypothetical protein [Planctomycetia bacterium]
MFSDTQFWRLVWKEYRVQRPLWLALLIASPVLQLAWLVLMWIVDGPRAEFISPDLARGFFAIGFVTSAIYLLGCCATMFSVEHETGSFDFQRVLPSNQPRLFFAKVGFAAVSFLVLTAALWLLTQILFVRFAAIEPSWFGAYGVLYMAELFVWSVLASLMIRQPLWAVIIAVSLQSLMMQVTLPYLTTGKHGFDVSAASEDFKLLMARIVVLVLIAVADIVVGKFWFEDRLRLPRWRFGMQPDMALSYPAAGELPPYLGQRQLGWSRLLWLGWRDARWVVGAVLLWYVCCLKLTPTLAQWHALMLPYFIGSFVCGLFAFGSEQWGGRFRFVTERGCTPRIVWLSRHATWLPPVVLMTLGGAWLCWRNPQAFQRDIACSQFEWSSVLIGPFVCYSAAQFAAMICRNTVMALAVGLFLTIMGIIWSIGMTSWLAPIWWSIGAWPVIGLFVTWLKANDWIEERRDRVARWRLALGLGVPICLLLITCATYRVIQIPVVTLPPEPPEWDEAPQALARLTPAEKATLDLYRRALIEIERGEDQLETYEARKVRLKQAHPDWTDNQIHTEAYTEFHRDWLAQHVEVLPLLREAHRMPPVPLALVEEGLPKRPIDWYPERFAKLTWFMIRQGELSLQSGQLDQAWEEIVVAFEMQRRFNLRASLTPELFGPRIASNHEAQLMFDVTHWGRHKDQTRERVIAAIRKLEEIASSPEAMQYDVHREFLEAREMLKFGDRWKKHVQRQGQHNQLSNLEVGLLRKIWMFSPWERWRSERVMRWQSWIAWQRAEQLRSLLKWNLPTGLPSISIAPDSEFARTPNRIPANEREKLLTKFGDNSNSPESVIARSALVPPNMYWGLVALVENNFIHRLESFRATTLLLALADFHREHDRYPESLSELVPTYFAETPRDPLTAGPIVYFPHGVSEDVIVGQKEHGTERVVIRQGVPFLWMPHSRVSGLKAQPSANGGWEFVNQFGKVEPLTKALSQTKIWPVENAAGELKK